MLILPSLKNRRWLRLLLLAAIYISFYFWIGVIIVGDTHAYVTGSVRVSPLYPLLLGLFRAVFTEAYYFTAVVIFQELLLAWAIFSLTEFLDVRFSLGFVWKTLAAGLLVFLMYLLWLITAGRQTECFFCNAIMTEGIAYPLYLLCFKYVFAAVDARRPKYLLTAAALSFLLTNTRSTAVFAARAAGGLSDDWALQRPRRAE